MMRLGYALLVVVLGLGLWPSAAVQAASYSYQGNTSFDFGALPGFTAGTESGGSETILEIGSNASGGANLLGCSGIDIAGFFNMTFNVGNIIENFTSYMQTMVAKWLLTQLFTSPQLASIFDTLQAFGNARLDMFKASCSLGEIKAAARKQVVDQCARDAGGGAEAIKKCEENYDSESKDLLTKAADKYLEFMRAHANVNQNMQSTSFCGSNPDSKVCGLAAFIPQMRLCVSGGGGDKSDGSCVDFGGNAKVAPQIIPFTSVMTSINNVYRDAIVEPVSSAIGQAIGQGVTMAQLRISRTNQLAKQKMAEAEEALKSSQNGDGKTLQYFTLDKKPITFAGDDEDDSGAKAEYKKYLQCSNTDPYTDAVAYFEQVNSDWGTSFPTDFSSYAEASKVAMENIANITGASNKTQSELSNTVLPEAAALLELTINCVSNHHIHVSIDTMLAAQMLDPKEQRGYYASAANRAGFLGTDLFMNYVRRKVITSYMEMSANPEKHPYYSDGGCEGRVLSPAEVNEKKAEAKKNGTSEPEPCSKEQWEYPQQMAESIKSMADEVGIQQQAIDSIRKEQDMFARYSAVLAKKQATLEKEYLQDFINGN